MDKNKVAATLLMASAVTVGAPAMAAPITPLSVAAKPEAAQTDVVQARFGGWHGGWGHGWHGGGWGWGLGAALAGAAIGAAVTAPYYYGGYDPYYYGAGYPVYGYGYAPVPTYTYTYVRPYWRHHYGWYHRPYWRSYAWGW